MAVDVYTENFVDMISPRLSFSRDPGESEAHTISEYSCTLDQSLMDSTFDFAFNVDTSLTFPSSSADELFSDGKMLPTCVKKDEMQNNEALEEPVRPCLDPSPSSVTEVRKKSLKEFLEDSFEEEEPNIVAKSFWRFRRSNSLNCDRNHRKGLIGSWKILSRSGSTGKFLEKIMEDEEKPSKSSNLHTNFFWKFGRNNSLKCEDNDVSNKGSIVSSNILRRSQSTSDYKSSKLDSSSNHYRRSNSTGSAPYASNGYKFMKKQQSRKQQQQQVVGNVKLSQKGKVKDNSRCYSYANYNYNNNSNSMRVSPMLNIPSPYISRVSVDLLSFGSLFCNGSKDGKKKK